MFQPVSVSAWVLCVFLCSSMVQGQEPPAMPTPTKEHTWLAQFVGEWTSQSKGTMGPDQPPMECNGTLVSRKIGGFWIQNELKGDMAGEPMIGLQMIGYDESKKKYVGTWADSMTSFMWHYQGTVDSTGKILTLEAEGPNFLAPGKMSKFQDIYEFKSADEMIMTSKMQGEDGKWITFMSGTAKRKR